MKAIRFLSLFFLVFPFTSSNLCAEVNTVAMPYQNKAIVNDNLPIYYDILKKQQTYSYSWLSAHNIDFNQWKYQTRQFFKEKLLVPESTIDFDYQIIDERDRGTYIAQKIIFNISDNNRVLGFLLIPKSNMNKKFPAVVLFHDHGAKYDIGKEKVIETWGNREKELSAKMWVDKFLSGKFIGNELAKKGYVVFATDAIGWSDRGEITYEQQQALASNFFNLGRSLAGVVAYEDKRTIDFIASLSIVDRSKIAAMGFSFGAYRAWQSAALSHDISATVAISWFGDYQGLMTAGNNVLRGQSSFYMLHPGVADKLDIPDVASLTAPNAILLFNGGKDNLFPEYSVQNAYNKIHQIWKSQNADNKVITKMWPNLGHVFVEEQQKEAFDWLDKQFKEKTY